MYSPAMRYAQVLQKMCPFSKKSSGLRWGWLLSLLLVLSLRWARSYSSMGTIAGKPLGMIFICSLDFRLPVPLALRIFVLLQIVRIPILAVSVNSMCTVDGCQAVLFTLAPLLLAGGKMPSSVNLWAIASTLISSSTNIWNMENRTAASSGLTVSKVLSLSPQFQP